MAVLPQLVAGSVGLAYIVQKYSSLPLGIVSLSAAIFLTLSLSYIFWAVVIYPRFFSPFRHLPTPQDNAFFTGQTKRIMRAASGEPMREWTEHIENDGLIHYSMWFQERLYIESLLDC